MQEVTVQQECQRVRSIVDEFSERVKARFPFPADDEELNHWHEKFWAMIQPLELQDTFAYFDDPQTKRGELVEHIQILKLGIDHVYRSSRHCPIDLVHGFAPEGRANFFSKSNALLNLLTRCTTAADYIKILHSVDKVVQIELRCEAKRLLPLCDVLERVDGDELRQKVYKLVVRWYIKSEILSILEATDEINVIDEDYKTCEDTDLSAELKAYFASVSTVLVPFSIMKVMSTDLIRRTAVATFMLAVPQLTNKCKLQQKFVIMMMQAMVMKLDDE